MQRGYSIHQERREEKGEHSRSLSLCLAAAEDTEEGRPAREEDTKRETLSTNILVPPNSYPHLFSSCQIMKLQSSVGLRLGESEWSGWEQVKPWH
ncbi:unnamed protein product [Pleuronectes platessa]|uniref:Uncharacterized protein n=1 Tax=Pleuronectes platessa TaxID=8262 RepID=A0A9N7Y1M1_PLEPL|nr:unnamed protein product [Pleuronectes platessa]